MLFFSEDAFCTTKIFGNLKTSLFFLKIPSALQKYLALKYWVFFFPEDALYPPKIFGSLKTGLLFVKMLFAMQKYLNIEKIFGNRKKIQMQWALFKRCTVFSMKRGYFMIRLFADLIILIKT